jgi:hypothetical protein
VHRGHRLVRNLGLRHIPTRLDARLAFKDFDGMLLHLIRVGLAVAALLLMEPPAEAAAFRTDFPACQDKGLLKQAWQNPKDPSGVKAVAFLDSKIESGACIRFSRSQQVSIDERDGPLSCVRRPGDLECFWTLDKAVDPNPPITSGGAGSGGGRAAGHRGPR